MKQELIFLWINSYRCLSNVEFNFSPQFMVTFDSKKNEITIQKKNNINIFAIDNIMNLSAIIGENGSGKTSILQFLNSLSCTPLCKIDKQGYNEFIEEQNSKLSYVAVYFVDRKIQIINKTENLVYYNN